MTSQEGATVSNFGPAWNSRAVMTCAGMPDTRIDTGEDYPTITLAAIFTMEPGDKPKLQGPAIIPSTFHDYNAREHKTQRESGEYVLLTVDIDHGNPTLARVEELVKSVCGDAAYLIYSSANACPGDMRWRAMIPLHDPLPFDQWHDAQNALFNFFEGHGIECDRALDRAGQLVFLPNVPETHDKSGEELRDAYGFTNYYQRSATPLTAPALKLELGRGPLGSALSDLLKQRAADDRERDRLRKEAEQRRANQPQRDGLSIIDEFNRNNTIADLFTLYGYEQSSRHGEDWRSPLQTSGSYATRIFGDKWVSLSASDAANRIGQSSKTGCYGDAYDLFVHFEHGGDDKSAFRTLYAERRASTLSPPPIETGDPGWTEPPVDAPDEDCEPIYELPAADEPAHPDGLPHFWFDEAAPNLDARDFLEGLLTDGTMSVVYGPSNCGKTFFVLDLSLHVAKGAQWRGNDVDQGAVVYLSLEGAAGLRNRLSAFRKHYNIGDERLPFVAMPKPISLLASDDDVNAVIDLVHKIAHETEKPVRMVVVDTLSRAMAGGNENSPEDMTALIGNCDRIRDATGAHICIVHHSGKDQAKGARGHSSLRAATDTEIEINREPQADFSSVRIAKQRDLEAGEPFAFSLKSIPLGTNRRGKDVTSCVVVEAQNADLSAVKASLSQKENEGLQVLRERIETIGFETEIGPRKDLKKVVSRKSWSDGLQNAGVTSRDNPGSSRSQFRRIQQGLEQKQQIGVFGEWVWLA